MKRYRRWRRKRLTNAPAPWLDKLSTGGVLLLVLGAVLIGVYVARLH